MRNILCSYFGRICTRVSSNGGDVVKVQPNSDYKIDECRWIALISG